MNASATLNSTEWINNNALNVFEESDSCRVAVTRSEAGSCVLDGNIYLVGGYSWMNRGRIDNVECVNTGEPKTGAEDRKLHGDEGADCKAANIKNYPMRCTGIACAVLPLYKAPQMTFDLLALPEPEQPEVGKTTKRGNRILPKSAHPRVFPSSEFGADEEMISTAPFKLGQNNVGRANSASPRANNSPNLRSNFKKSTDIFQWLENSRDAQATSDQQQSPIFDDIQPEVCGDKSTNPVFLTQ
uniref:Uncharacterized protein n=1 Tax=Ciona savignyi TaxID=51511 RepID=H2ZB14_CIOSA